MLPFWLAPRARAQRGNAQGTTGGLPGGGATGCGEHQKLGNSGGVPIAQLGDDAKPPTATSNFKPEMEMGQGDASSAPFVKDAVSGLWKSGGKPRRGGQCG